MEKRSRRRTRDLVTQAASQGLSQNKIACARISMMARSTYAPSKGRIQMRKTTPSICSHSACTARPVHTVVPQAPYDFDHAGLGIAKSTDKNRPLSEPRPRVRPPAEPTQTDFMMANDLR